MVGEKIKFIEEDLPKIDRKGIQFVASILKDKLPEELNKDEYVILKLSQDDKLFRIERGD